MPAVSVCVPTMNSARTICATVESILGQSFDDFELVVTDNASDDDTVALVNAYGDARIRIEQFDQRVPMGANWSRAVSGARAELVKLVCSDDLITDNCLAEQVPTIMDHRDLALIASRFDLIDDEGVLLETGLGLTGMIGSLSAADAMRIFLRRLPDELFPSAAAIFRRRDFERTSGFRDDYGYTLDIDVWLQIMEFGGFLGSPSSLAANRASKFNVSSSTSTLEKARDIVGFNRWAMRTYGGRRGPLRRSDRLIGDARVAEALVRRVYARSIGH